MATMRAAENGVSLQGTKSNLWFGSMFYGRPVVIFSGFEQPPPGIADGPNETMYRSMRFVQNFGANNPTLRAQGDK